MATTEEVRNLAALARIRLEDTELEKFTGEFDAILAYVGKLDTLELPKAGVEKPVLRNVMRADGEPHVSGAHTEKLAVQFSAREGDALAVKKIISHD